MFVRMTGKECFYHENTKPGPRTYIIALFTAYKPLALFQLSQLRHSTAFPL